MERGTGSVYEALDVLADAVKPIRARKNLVLFSPGIVDISESVRHGMIVDRSRYLDPALQSLNAANVSVYSAQLQRPIETRVSTTPYFHQRLTELASATGGEYFQFGTSFKPVVKKVEKTNAGYYLVTYRSKKPRGEKGFQKVDVSLRNPEFRVVARSGYEFGS
jgi:VWFA-related protein